MKTWLLCAALLTLGADLAASAEREDTCFAPPNTTMTCDNRGLSRPPPGKWIDISNLDLSHNDISALDRDTFAAFPNVAVLQMKRNALREMHAGTFARMPYLETLDLQDNAVDAIVPPPAGERMESLRYLFLNNNSIKTLDPDVLQVAAPNLKYLFLNNNPLVVHAGRPVLNHQEVVLVHLQWGARLRLGRKSFAGVPKLREAVLVGAGVTSVDGAFAANPRLEVLSLARNNITELKPGWLPSSGAVQGLWLGGNPLRRVDEAAVAAALRSGGHLGIDDTPMACDCAYQHLQSWAANASVSLHAACTSASESQGAQQTHCALN